MASGISISNTDGSVVVNENSNTFYYVVASGALSTHISSYGPPSANYAGAGRNNSWGDYASTISYPTQTKIPLLVFSGCPVVVLSVGLSSATIAWTGAGGKYAVLSTDLQAPTETFGMQIFDASGNRIYATEQTIFFVDSSVYSTSSSYYLLNNVNPPTAIAAASALATTDSGFSTATAPTPPYGATRFSTAYNYVYKPFYAQFWSIWADTRPSTPLACAWSGVGSYTIDNTNVRSAMVVYNKWDGITPYSYYETFENPSHQIMSGYMFI